MAEYATSIEIEASPEEVFEYLVTPDGMTAWMGQRADLDPRPGGAFDVDIAGSPVRGKYLEVDRPHRVVVSWGVADSAEFPPGASRVSFTLTPTAHGTRVDLLHSGLPELMVAGHADGWAHFLPRLLIVAKGGVAGEDGWTPLPRDIDRTEQGVPPQRPLLPPGAARSRSAVKAAPDTTQVTGGVGVRGGS